MLMEHHALSHDTRFIIFIWWHRRSSVLSLAILGLSANLIGCAQNVEKNCTWSRPCKPNTQGLLRLYPHQEASPSTRKCEWAAQRDSQYAKRKGRYYPVSPPAGGNGNGWIPSFTSNQEVSEGCNCFLPHAAARRQAVAQGK